MNGKLFVLLSFFFLKKKKIHRDTSSDLYFFLHVRNTLYVHVRKWEIVHGDFSLQNLYVFVKAEYDFSAPFLVNSESSSFMAFTKLLIRPCWRYEHVLSAFRRMEKFKDAFTLRAGAYEWTWNLNWIHASVNVYSIYHLQKVRVLSYHIVVPYSDT